MGKRSWKDIHFVTDNSYDRLVILTYPYQDTLEAGYLKEKALTFMTEPSLSFYAKPHPTTAVLSTHLHLPFFPSNIDLLNRLAENGQTNLTKQDLLSVIVSELSAFPGHQRRLKLVYFVDQLIHEGLDIFGRPSNGNFFSLLSNYRFFLPDKYEGLWSYKYHLTCENCFEEGYFTEKLVDPIVTETLCFYDGCPNIEQYIDSRAYVKINVSNLEESLETIVKVIRDNEWERRLPFIKNAKRRFLTDLHPFNMIWMAVHDKDVSSVYQTSK